MSDANVLPGLLLLPALGALLVPWLGRSAAAARWFTAGVMGATLLLALNAFTSFEGAGAPAHLAVDWPWMPSLGVSLRFAVDGFNVYLLLLTALLFPAVLACAWPTPEAQDKLYLCLLLALQAALLGTFLAQNLVVLFVLWEAVLIPMLLLIVVYGGPQRRQAAMSFFLYTMAGSVLFLAAVIVLGFEHQSQTGRWSFDLDALGQLALGPRMQTFVFAAIALACAVKSPIVPFHAWLPLAYGEASPSGTALMAGVMSKMGAFGFIKLAIPLCPDVVPVVAPWMAGLGVLGILYGAVLALRQAHIKQLVAYASLSHMGYIVLGLFSLQHTAIHGALLQILSHGLSVAGLFLMLGLLEQRRGAAYAQTQALSTQAPRLAVVWMLFTLASLALPSTSGFTAEFLILLGAFTQGLAAWQAQGGAGLLLAALAASLGVMLGATYMLRMARTLLYGPPPPTATPMADIRRREALALAPLLALILWLGVWPAPWMSKVEAAVAQLASQPAGQTATLSRTAAASGATHGR